MSEGSDGESELASLLQQKAELLELRERNSQESVKKSRSEHEKNKRSLKSDLKKTTAFVKKVKNITADGLQQCIRETETLNLNLYISEIVVALLETGFKATDVAAIVQLCACLHQRYEEFTNPLITGLKTCLMTFSTSEDDKDGPKKRRIQSRLMIELYQAGVFTDDAFFLSVVKMLLGKRKAIGAGAGEGSAGGGLAINRKHADLQGLTAFVKYGSEILMGYCPPKVQSVCTAAGKPLDLANMSIADLTADSCPVKLLCSSDVCEAIREQVLPAFTALSEDLVKAHKELRSKERKFEKDTLLHGSLSEEKQAILDNATKFFEKLLSVVQALSESLNESMPELQEEEEEVEKRGGLTVVERTEAEYGPYADQEAYQFYDDLPDLLAIMPLAVFGMTEEQAKACREKWKAERDARLGKGLEGNDGDGDGDGEGEGEGEGEEEVPTLSEEPEPEPDDEGEGTGTGDGEKVSSYTKLANLLAEKLPDCITKLRCDQFCEAFCSLSPAKGHRKRLVSALLYVPRTRMDLIPFYSRIVATLCRIFPDIAPPVLEQLRRQFFGALKHKGQVYIDDKTRNIRYIAELCKFGVAPPMYVFRVFRDLLCEFQHHNIDLTARLMEDCGRYLYLLPHSHSRIVDVMETSLRLKRQKNVDMRQSALLESAYFAVKPPEREAKKAVVYTLAQKYAHYLLFRKLGSPGTSVDVIIRCLRRLPWHAAEEGMESCVIAAMLRVVETKYVNIMSLADCLSGLRKFQPNVVVKLVDTVLEAIFRGLEVPYRREPQKLVGMLRLVGELYNFEVLSSSVVYDVLYLIINHGHEVSTTTPPFASPGSGGESAGTTTAGGGGGDAGIGSTDSLGQAPPAAVQAAESVYVFDKRTGRVISRRRYDPRAPSDKDPRNDLFRAQLVCELLKACGAFLTAPGVRARLTRFLTYFQRWLLVKPSVPVHIEYLILDTFDLLEEAAWKADVAALERAASGKAGAATAAATAKGKKKLSRKALEAEERLRRQQQQHKQGPLFPKYESLEAAVEACVVIEESEQAKEAARQASGATGAVEGEEEEEEEDDDDNEGEDEDEEEEEDDEDEDDDDDEEDDEDDEDEEEEEEEESESDSDGTFDRDDDDLSEAEAGRRMQEMRAEAQGQEEDEFEEMFRSMMTESLSQAQTAKSVGGRAGSGMNRMAVPAILPRPKNLPQGVSIEELEQESQKSLAAATTTATATATATATSEASTGSGIKAGPKDWADSDSDSDSEDFDGEEEGDTFGSLPSDRASAPAPAPAPGAKLGGKVVFKMLSRDSKGKVESRVFAVPEQAPMAVKLAQAKGAKQAEKDALKRRTLALQEASDIAGNPPRANLVVGRGGKVTLDGGAISPGENPPSGTGLDEFLHSVREDELRSLQQHQQQQGGRGRGRGDGGRGVRVQGRRGGDQADAPPPPVARNLDAW